MKYKGISIFGLVIILIGGGLFFSINNNNALMAPVFYVANAGDGTISQINIEERVPVETINLNVEQLSHGIAISPDETIVYYGTGFQGMSLQAYRVDTKEVINELNFNEGIHGIDIHPSGKYLYVSLMAGLGEEGGVISVVDTTTFDEVVVIETDDGPAHVSVTTDGSQVWVTNVNANTVSVIDAYSYQVLATIPVGDVPNEVAVSPNFDYAFSANVNSNSLSVIDMITFEVVQEIEVGEGVHGVTVSPDGSQVWTANNHSNDVSVVDIDTLTVVTTIETGSYANHISFSPDGDLAFVTHRDSNSLAVIDTRKYEVLKDLELGSEPHEMTLKGMEIINGEESAKKSEESEVWDVSLKMRYAMKDEAFAEGVGIEASFLSPYNREHILYTISNIDVDPFNYFAVKIGMTTHSGDLLSLPFEERVVLTNNLGVEVRPEHWIVVSSDSHHPLFLALFEKTIDKAPLLKNTDTELILKFDPFIIDEVVELKLY